MSQFQFLSAEWKDLYEAATKAEETAVPDPRTSCFYARRALELAVAWAYKFDRALKLPYQDNISALIHEPTFKQTAGDAVFNKARVIITLGNRAVHSHRDIPQAKEAERSCKALYGIDRTASTRLSLSFRRTRDKNCTRQPRKIYTSSIARRSLALTATA